MGKSKTKKQSKATKKQGGTRPDPKVKDRSEDRIKRLREEYERLSTAGLRKKNSNRFCKLGRKLRGIGALPSSSKEDEKKLRKQKARGRHRKKERKGGKVKKGKAEKIRMRILPELAEKSTVTISKEVMEASSAAEANWRSWC